MEDRTTEGDDNVPWWHNKDQMEEALRQHGTCAAISTACGGDPSPSTLRYWCQRLGIKLRRNGGLGSSMVADTTPPELEIPDKARRIKELLVKRNTVWTVETLADAVDCAPKIVRDALATLRRQGFRIPEEDQGPEVVLQKLVPAKQNLHKSLLKGTEVAVGVVSDTHLYSKEHAPGELELAYDMFKERGITEVWHSGDLVCGAGIYRTQIQDVIGAPTFENEVDFAVKHYPRRKGIVTRLIAGNHDIEGDFGRMGANPVIAVCNQRDDMEYLGDFEAHIELPNGAWAQLLHPKGGATYALSYKPQKIVEGLPAGRKPVVLVLGHWHVRGSFESRGVECVLAGCFEWRTNLLKRIGLQPQVGFHILTMVLGKDGTLVRVVPEWFRFYEGRVAVRTRSSDGS